MHMTHNCATCPREPTTTGYMYVLSSDCVDFVVKNRQALRPLAHLDDITIGLWMLAMQVHATSLPGVLCANLGHPCKVRKNHTFCPVRQPLMF